MFAEWRARESGADESTERRVSVPGKPEAFTGSAGVTYRTTFSDPRDSSDQVAVLELRGLYAHASIEASGTRLDGDWPVEHDAYFAPLQIPFVPATDEENELVIETRAPRDRFGGIHDTDHVPDSESVPGIWWDVSLDARPLPYIERIDVQPRVDGGDAELTVSTTVVTDEPLDEYVSYSVRPHGELQTRGVMQRGGIESTKPGRTTATHRIDMHDPALWWPREFGPQNRYDIRAKLGEDEQTVTTGIADVTVEDGQFIVNGTRLAPRGVTILTSDPTDIDRACSVNANVIRARGHVLPEEFYERCDEEGMLLWQDMPLTGPGAFDVERGTALATALARTRSRHPSLAAFAVHDEPVRIAPEGLGSGLFDRLRFRYRVWRAQYDVGPAETVARVLNEERPTVPVVGCPGIGQTTESERTDAGRNWRAGAYYPGWEYGAATDIERLLESYPTDVVAAYGAGSVTSETPTPAAVRRPYYDRHGNSISESQRHQEAVLQCVTGHLRSGGVGAIACCLRDAGDEGLGVYERDGSPKPAQSVLKRTFEPVQAFVLDPSPGASEVVVVNDRRERVQGTLQWSAGDKQGTIEVNLAESGVLRGEPISIPEDAEEIQLCLDCEEFTVEHSYKASN